MQDNRHNTADQGDETRTDSYVHDDPVVDAALEWFGIMQAPATPAEQAGFAAWLAENPRHADEYDAIRTLWAAPSFAQAIAATGAGPARRRFGWSARFASVAAAVALGVLALQGPDLWLRWQSDYVTLAGQQEQVTLPDGSHMLMNTASAVAIDFAQGRRNVRVLAGEVYFDVVHDPAHPFTVTGGFGTARVLGTSFALRRARGDDTVLLEEGRVAISCLCNNPVTADLQAGEVVSVMGQGVAAKTTADVPRLLGWRTGRITLRDMSLATALDEIGRYYGHPIILAHRGVGDKRVSGSYRLDAIEAGLQSLADSAGLQVMRLPGGIIILR